MKRVAILTYSGVALFELGCAFELFGLSRPEFDTWYTCETIKFSDDAVSAAGGIQVEAKHVDNLYNYDMVVVPSWPVSENSPLSKLVTAFLDFYKSGGRILSFCSGAFLLARLGFFSGRKATTHWRYMDSFQAQFPDISIVDNALYFFDGQIGCSAGSSAGLDLGLEVIRADFGHEKANAVARRLVISAHRKGNQSQFSDTPIRKSNDRFASALDWAIQHLDTNISIECFAQQAAMSRRTFDRKFKANFNITPKVWLTHQRLNQAKTLLESHSFDIDTVAQMSGFNNGITLRHHFRKELGISPSFYRAQFTLST